MAAIIKSNFGNRIVNVECGTHNAFFAETLEIKGIDKIGIVIEILKVISEENNVNVSKINIESNAGVFLGLFEVIIHDTKDINNLINNLIKIKEINSVQRVQK